MPPTGTIKLSYPEPFVPKINPSNPDLCSLYPDTKVAVAASPKIGNTVLSLLLICLLYVSAVSNKIFCACPDSINPFAILKP